MARARTKNTPFDFDNAAPGSPGPDGSPVIDRFVTDSGIPGVETRSAQGLRTFTFPLAAVHRQPVSGVMPPPAEASQRIGNSKACLKGALGWPRGLGWFVGRVVVP